MDNVLEESDFTPRPYQVDLFEKAAKQNSIIYLPTGTGKTYVAVLLIKKFSNSLMIPYKDGGKRTIFIVNTVALVVQQSAFIARHTGLKCQGYSGDMKVDFWTNNKWLEEIENNQVLVMTGQIFVDMLNHGAISLKKVNLLIFDECHRAVGSHPMRLIMQTFKEVPENQQPRVLAMSASLLNANIKSINIETTLKELEATFNAKIITVDELNSVADFATNPQELLEKYNKTVINEVMEKIFKLIDDSVCSIQAINCPNLMENPESSNVFKRDRKTDKLRRILQDIKEHFQDMGLYGGWLSVLFHLIQIEFLKKSTDQTTAMMMLEFITTKCMLIQSILEKEIGTLDEIPLTLANLSRYSSGKVETLVKVLKESYNKQQKNNKKFCCIVFVQRRFTAKIIYHILKKLSGQGQKTEDQSFAFIKPEYVIGHNADPYKSARETLILSKWGKEALVRFRNGISNCIVATDVIDEGVDIPACTLVVRYHAPMDFRSYIQSKGRARHKTSNFIVLVPDDKYIERYVEFQNIENILRNLLHGKSEQRSKPTEEEIEKFLHDYEIEPFIVHKADGTTTQITQYSAIALINRYCACLLKSKFILLSPAWVKQDIPNKYETLFQVHLTLPLISPLQKTIIGEKMSTIDGAKRSAALKACIELYKIKELNEKFLPKKLEESLEEAGVLFPHWREEEKINGIIPGTHKKKRLHTLKQADAFFGAFPQQGQSLYLHIIDMVPNYPPPDENRHLQFYKLLSSSENFGILSTKQMPMLPSFPIFMNVGSIQIYLKSNKVVQPLNYDQIEALKRFHTIVFHNVLEMIKDFQIFDCTNQANCFLTVPVKNESINWDVVMKYETFELIPPATPLVVKTLDYELALVKANYRESHVYVVTEICEFLKAESTFPTLEFETYCHYFDEKHGIKIKSPAQPLLEVKPISQKINCIKPRNIKPNISKRKRQNMTEDFEEHLVPELCDRLCFPSVYYLKATALPSILFRITQLLIAEDFRLKIQKEANLSCLTPKSWQPWQVNEGFESKDNSYFDDSFDKDDEPMINIENLEITGPDIDILNEEKSLYSWEEKEPTDIFRNVDTIRMLDIEYYFRFLSGSNHEDIEKLKYQNAIKSQYVDSKRIPVLPIKMLNKTNSYGPSVIDILQCLTAKCSNDVLNFERVETLGDSFLKFAVSLFLFQKYPEYNEGYLTFLKGRLLGNMNLYFCAEQKNIAGRINVEEFSPNRNFIVPSYSLERKLMKLMVDKNVSLHFLYELNISSEEKWKGILTDETKAIAENSLINYVKGSKEISVNNTGVENFVGCQVVSDKTVADCVEAIIGTYLLSLGIEGGLSILKWFEILPKTLIIEEFLKEKVPDPKLGAGDLECLIPWADYIETKIGYTFNNKAFLLQAFTHPSFVTNRITGSYQRLEFLGDAILDFTLTAYIFENCGNLSPGELTDLRSALVNNITFSCLAVRHGLNTALQAFAPKIFEHVDRFVKFQENRNYKIDDELLWVLLEEEDCQMAEHVDVPKVLGDLFESTIGAIYLDSGKNLKLVWEVIYSIMHKEIAQFSKCIPRQPIRIIHEKPGVEPKFSKAYELENENKVMVTLSIKDSGNTKFFHGFGATKKLAKCAASKMALKYLYYKKIKAS